MIFKKIIYLIWYTYYFVQNAFVNVQNKVIISPNDEKNS